MQLLLILRTKMIKCLSFQKSYQAYHGHQGFDIKTADDDGKKSLEKMYEVQMTENDEQFYLDNC